MIQRFTFGCPLPTESVVLPVESAAAAVPYLCLLYTSDAADE